MFMFYIYKSDSIFNCETQTIQHFEKWTNDKIFSLEKIIEHQVKILIYRQYGMIWNLQANKLSCWIQKLQQNKPKKPVSIFTLYLIQWYNLYNTSYVLYMYVIKFLIKHTVTPYKQNWSHIIGSETSLWPDLSSVGWSFIIS